MKTRHSLSALLLTLFFSLSSCDLFDSSPKVEELFWIGSELKSDFLDTGELTLIVTPVDENGQGVLDRDIKFGIEISEPQKIDVQVEIPIVVKPNNDIKSFALLIDGSGSLRDNDRNRTRVEGARELVKELLMSELTELAIFEFPKKNFGPFDYTTMHHDYSRDQESLLAVLDDVGQQGGTPLYDSAKEVLEHLESTRSTNISDNQIVLFSDGEPNDRLRRDDVCRLAQDLETSFLTIGLGPASELSSLANSFAIAELRSLAECSPGGSYTAINENDPAEIVMSFQRTAISVREGRIELPITLIGDGFDSLRAGDTVKGTIGVENVTPQEFQFVVPRR